MAGETNDQANSASGTPVPPRSPKERAVVWGGILVLLGIMAVQAFAWVNFSRTKAPLQKAVSDSDDSEHVVTEEMVKGWIRGTPALETGTPESALELPSAKRMDTYTWKGIVRDYQLKIFYGLGTNPEVVEIRTN